MKTKTIRCVNPLFVNAPEEEKFIATQPELDFLDKDINVREIVIKLVGNHIMKDNLWRTLKKR